MALWNKLFASIKQLTLKKEKNDAKPSARVYSSPVAPEYPGTRPENYMDFFAHHEGGIAWYEWMHDSRKEQHECFQHWFSFIDSIERVNSIGEFGCGYGVFYPRFFTDREYLGIDMSKQAIDWCKKNRFHHRHSYTEGDFINFPATKKYDLIFSQGTIDNTYNIDEFLRSAVNLSSKWIYISAYRGYFGTLLEHEYRIVKEQGTFYNDISPNKIYETLAKLGAQDISVFPSFTGGRTDSPGIPYETVITARVKPNSNK